MNKVYSRQEARDWFLENSSRSVVCVSVIDREEITASCFPVADKFYRDKAEKVEIDDKNAISQVGEPKNKAEQVRIINNKFDDILRGITPKDNLMMNIALPTRDFGISSGFDEITILKLMVINYHKTLSEVMNK